MLLQRKWECCCQIYFFCMSDRLLDSDTPKMFELEDNDVIHVMHNRTGC